MNSLKAFNLMKGSWNMYRTITSPKFQPMTGAGKAVFEQFQENKNALLYKEELILQLSSESINAKREYIFRLIEDDVSVYFNENPERFFYTLKFAPKTPSERVFDQAGGEHLCGNDNYKASYNFFDNDNFELIYKVVGPQKDYIMTTKYSRI